MATDKSGLRQLAPTRLLHEVTPETVPDKRYPKGVKAWPAAAWMDVYGVDLAELFGEVAA